MYTIKIENIEKTNGQPFASVSFTRDTGETEAYKELVLKTPEVAEARDEETGEITVQAAEAVYEYIDKTRPVIEVVYERIQFNDQDQLDALITSKKNELIAKHDAAAAVPVGEYTPSEIVTVEPTEEEIARNLWLENWRTYQQAKKGIDALKDADIEPTEEELTRFNALKTWVAENRKPEYSQYI